MNEEEFRPKLGRVRARSGKSGKTYVNRVLHAASKVGATGLRNKQPSSKFAGTRIGRGGAVGTVAAGHAYGAGRRRVIVKARIVKLKSGNLGAAKAHLNYIRRDGVTRDGEPGRLYDAISDDVDGKPFLEQTGDDRHQFRFIVAAEDATEIDDLKPFTRDLMNRMEEDLGTRLEWVAVDHFNTGHPHTHIIVRGKDDRGKDLVIARDYMSHGLRERARDLMTLELGPEAERDILQKRAREVAQERFTPLDRQILKDADNGRLEIAEKPLLDPVRHAHRQGRLRTLERLGLATEQEPGVWALSSDLEPTLRRLGERGDIIKTLHREMHGAALARGEGSYTIFDAEKPDTRIVGCVISVGLSDELGDRQYLVIDGLDGQVHYADIGKAASDDPVAKGMIVTVQSRSSETPRQVDRTIAEIGSLNSSLYSPDLHATYDKAASPAFIETHVRRLEALRRKGIVSRLDDGTWDVGTNYLETVQSVDFAGSKARPVQVQIVSYLRIEKLTEADGATWLDRQIVSRTPEAIRGGGFGAETINAINRRRQWLVEQQLVEQRGGDLVVRRNLLQALRRRELARTGEQISGNIGLGYSEVKPGEEVRGTYRRSVLLASGKFALIERAQDFTLMPWRSILERQLGRAVVGTVTDGDISWDIRPRRGLGRIQ